MDRAAICALLPHAGAMCLLNRVLRWNAEAMVCATTTHLEAGNPLRVADALPAVCGVEYAMQAAALHGALTADRGAAVPGRLASLRDLRCTVQRLDDPRFGTLRIAATLQRAERGGAIYAFALHAEDGRELLAGTGTVANARP